MRSERSGSSARAKGAERTGQIMNTPLSAKNAAKTATG